MGKQIRHLMNKNFVAVPPVTSLETACELFREHKISMLAVVENDAPVGLLTERDMVRLIHQEVDAGETHVSDVMSSPATIIEQGASLFDAYSCMSEHNFRHLVVVDEAGRPVGSLSHTDMLAGMGMEYFVELRDVSSVMTRNLVRVRPTDSMRLVVNLMCNHQISCVVVEEQWLPVGIITESDVIRLCGQGFRPDQVQADSVMSTPVHTLPDTTYVPQASDVMRREGLRHMVVVDAQGRLAGVISLSDLIACLESRYISYLKTVIERQERQLGQLARKHGVVIRENPNPVIEFDSQGRITDANPAALQLTRCTLDALCGKTLEELVDDDSSAGATTVFAEAGDGKASHAELCLVDDNGNRIDVSTCFLPISDEDALLHVYAILHDVTQQKHMDRLLAGSAQMFDALAGLSGAVPLQLDLASRRFSYVGDGIEQLLGYPLASWNDIDSWLQRIADEDRAHVVEMLQQAQAGGSEKACRFSCRLLAMDGRTMAFEHYLLPQRKATDRIELSGFMLASYDA